MSYPKLYTSYILTKSGKHSLEETIIKDEHDKEQFINNLSSSRKYGCRDLNEEELAINGYSKNHYNKQEPKPGINISGNVIGSQINQDSLLSESPNTHKVITTPKIKESATSPRWYSKPLFKYFIWPVVTGLTILGIVELIIYFT